MKRWRAFVQALPFLFFALQSLVATYYSLQPEYPENANLRNLFRYLLALFMVISGGAHFTPSMYNFWASMVFLPFKAFWIYLSGLVFAAAGIALCIEQTQYTAAKVIAIALVAVFPANVACVVMRNPLEEVFGGSRTAAILRLPFQASFIAWAMWFTEPMVAV